MQEKIGKVTLDYEFYPGEDLYSDGPVEEELLEIARSYGEEELNRVIAEKNSWPVLYHFSHIRQNILEWLPIRKTDKVLEIGSGCGPITGALAKKAGSVTCIDLSKMRSTINAYRNRECDNVKIMVGNFQDIEVSLTEKYDYIMKEDAGRGYRRVVASPKPQEIVEIGTIRTMVDSGDLVIACGGGGIPVMRQGNHLKGASAVIDKDFASALLAKELDADFLIILTAVEKVALNYGKPDEKWLDDVTVEEAKQYVEEGHFAPGSMLPKVQAALDFAESKPGRQSLITLLEKAKDGILGETGTRIHL